MECPLEEFPRNDLRVVGAHDLSPEMPDPESTTVLWGCERERGIMSETRLYRDESEDSCASSVVLLEEHNQFSTDNSVNARESTSRSQDATVLIEKDDEIHVDLICKSNFRGNSQQETNIDPDHPDEFHISDPVDEFHIPDPVDEFHIPDPVDEFDIPHPDDYLFAEHLNDAQAFGHDLSCAEDISKPAETDADRSKATTSEVYVQDLAGFDSSFDDVEQNQHEDSFDPPTDMSCGHESFQVKYFLSFKPKAFKL